MVNPMQQMMGMFGRGGNPMGGMFPPMGGMFPPMPGGQQRRPVDRGAMRRYMSSIDDTHLDNLAAQARQQGMSEEDIKSGLDFLRRLRK